MAEAEALPRRGRRARRPATRLGRARLPARGRQPALPPLGADRARRLRGRRRCAGFKGGVIVVTKDGFANTLSQYDDFRAGALFDPDDLTAVRLHRRRLRRDLHPRGPRGRDGAQVRSRPDLPAPARPPPSAHQQISVNHPLDIDGTDVFLLSHGYAPHITVRNADGSVAFSGPVVFLPEDSTFRSFGVVKVPDAEQTGRPRSGSRASSTRRTASSRAGTADRSRPSPTPSNPAISMLAYRGDLGLDNGVPQSVYALQKKRLEPIRKADGKPLRLDLALGRQRHPARRARHRHLRRGEPLREAAGQPHPGPADRARPASSWP